MPSSLTNYIILLSEYTLNESICHLKYLLTLWFNLLQILNILFNFLLIHFFLQLVCCYHIDNIKMKVCSCHSLLKIFQLLSIWFWLIHIFFVSLSDFSVYPVIFSCPITVVSMAFFIIAKLFFSRVKLQWLLLSAFNIGSDVFLILDLCLLKTGIFWFPSSTNHPFEKFLFIQLYNFAWFLVLS